ncbi:hypothetical protein GCM10009000_104590 [Halobacterium noricense]
MNLNKEAIELYLKIEGRATIDDIKQDLDVDYIELFPILDLLTDENRISKEDRFYSVS